MLQGRVDRFARHVFARQTFTVTRRAIRQRAANNDVIGFRADVGSMANEAFERNADVKRDELGDSHAGIVVTAWLAATRRLCGAERDAASGSALLKVLRRDVLPDFAPHLHPVTVVEVPVDSAVN